MDGSRSVGGGIARPFCYQFSDSPCKVQLKPVCLVFSLARETYYFKCAKVCGTVRINVLRLVAQDLARKVVQNVGERLWNWHLLQVLARHYFKFNYWTNTFNSNSAPQRLFVECIGVQLFRTQILLQLLLGCRLA